MSTVLYACLVLGCGGSSSPSATPTPPAPSPSPPGSPSLPDVSGEWKGTLESSSFPARAITARLIQLADCVDGSWNTVSDSRWVGAISAFAVPRSLNGYMSIEYQVSGKLCSGFGTLNGPATETTATLEWSLTNYNADNCPGGIPNTMTLKLGR
jgi:hypothetical protein